MCKKYRGSWHLEEKIIAPDPEDRDNFGRALAIQGNLLVVTARKESDEEGAAYVFIEKGGFGRISRSSPQATGHLETISGSLWRYRAT